MRALFCYSFVAFLLKVIHETCSKLGRLKVFLRVKQQNICDFLNTAYRDVNVQEN